MDGHLLGHDVVFADELRGGLGVGVDPLDGGGIAVEEGVQRVGMLLGEGPPRYSHAGDEAGIHAQPVPLGGQVQRHPQAVRLHQGGGHEGLGQHGDARVGRGQRGQALGVLALPLDVHVRRRVDAVLFKDVVERVLRRRALAAGIDRAAREVGDALHALALFDDVQHAQRVDGDHLHRAVGVVVQHAGQVRGHAGHVRLALDKQRRHLVHGGDDVETGALVLGHQLDQSHGRGPLQRHDPKVRALRQRRAQHERQHTQERHRLFDKPIHFSSHSPATISPQNGPDVKGCGNEVNQRMLNKT